VSHGRGEKREDKPRRRGRPGGPGRHSGAHSTPAAHGV